MTALAMNCPESYERRRRRPGWRAALGALLTACLLGPGGGQAQPVERSLLEARDAFAKKDTARLAGVRAAMPSAHPLAVWVDYWELSHRLASARPDELDAFYARWPGSYLEDRLRKATFVLSSIESKKKRLIETMRLAISLLEKVDSTDEYQPEESSRKAG